MLTTSKNKECGLLILGLFCMLLLCNCSFQKRHYRKGYYVTSHYKKMNKSEQKLKERVCKLPGSAGLRLVSSFPKHTPQPPTKISNSRCSFEKKLSDKYPVKGSKTGLKIYNLVFYNKSNREFKTNLHLQASVYTKAPYFTSSKFVIKCLSVSNAAQKREVFADIALIFAVGAVLTLFIGVISWIEDVALLSLILLLLTLGLLLISKDRFKESPNSYSNRYSYKIAWAILVSYLLSYFILILVLVG